MYPLNEATCGQHLPDTEDNKGLADTIRVCVSLQ